MTSLDHQPHPLRWWALIAAALGVFMVALDTNIINVALPSMTKSFHVTRSIKWISLSYVLALVAVIAIAGRLSDVFGRKRIFLLGISVFILGSVLCGMAVTFGEMIVFRIVQGIGGAFIAAPIAAVATVLFPMHERGKAMGVVGIIGPLGGVTGPSVGGFLIDTWGWSSIFYINVPVGVISFLLLWKLLPSDSEFRKVHFDVPGALILAVASLFLMLGLSPDGIGFSASQEVTLGLSALLFMVFPWVENRVRQPMVPMDILKRANYSMPLLGILTSSMMGSGLMFLTPFFLQQHLGLTPSQIGLTVLFFPLAMAVAAQLGGTLADGFSTRLSAGIGAAIGLLGLSLYAPLHMDWTMTQVMWHLFLIGFGQGMFASPSNVAIMTATPREFIGVSSAVTNMARNLGFALGPTLDTLVWTPGNHSAPSSMAVVVYFIIGVQVVTLVSSFWYVQGNRLPLKSKV